VLKTRDLVRPSLVRILRHVSAFQLPSFVVACPSGWLNEHQEHTINYLPRKSSDQAHETVSASKVPTPRDSAALPTGGAAIHAWLPHYVLNAVAYRRSLRRVRSAPVGDIDFRGKFVIVRRTLTRRSGRYGLRLGAPSGNRTSREEQAQQL